MNGLEALNIFNDKTEVPTDIESIYFLFWDKGISLKEFSELPIPYILGILKVNSWKQKQEEKASKKARK